MVNMTDYPLPGDYNMSDGAFSFIGKYANDITQGYAAPTISFVFFTITYVFLSNSGAFKEHVLTLSFLITFLFSLLMTGAGWLNPMFTVAYLAGFFVALYGSSKANNPYG